MQGIFAHLFSAFILAITLFASPVTAQNDPTAPVPRCDVAPFDTCGFIDAVTSEFVVEPTFERAFEFYGDLAAVQINGKWGYINRSGEIVIEPRFDIVGTMQFGIAEAVLDGRFMLIDSSGTPIETPPFGRAVPISQDVVLAKTVEPNYVYPMPDYHRAATNFHPYRSNHFPNSGAFRLFHLENGWVNNQLYGQVEVIPQSSNGTVWIHDRTQNTPGFPRGLGLLNSNGEWVVAPEYYRASPSQAGTLIVNAENAAAIFDRDGNLIIETNEFETLRHFGHNHFIAGFMTLRRSGYWLLSRDGQPFNDVRYTNSIKVSTSSFNVVSDGEHWWEMGPDGRLQIHDREFNYTTNSARLERPQEPSVLSCGENGTELFYRNGPPSYRLHPFGERAFWLSILLSVLLIWLNGPDGQIRARHRSKLVLGTVLLVSAQIAFPTAIHGESRDINTSTRWGIQFHNGDVVIPAVHPVIHCFQDGFAYAPNMKRYEWCPIYPDGRWGPQHLCTETRYSERWSHSSPEPFHEDAFLSSVIWDQNYWLHQINPAHPKPVWHQNNTELNF